MTAEQHRELLEVVRGCEGRALLSGYRSELYDAELSGWARHEFDTANHAAGGGEAADDGSRVVQLLTPRRPAPAGKSRPGRPR